MSTCCPSGLPPNPKTLGQSRLNCDEAKDFEQACFIPSGFEAFVLDAEFGGPLLFEHIECDMAQDGKVLRAIARTEA